MQYSSFGRKIFLSLEPHELLFCAVTMWVRMRRHKLAALSSVISLQISQLLKTTSTSASDKFYLAYAGIRASQAGVRSVIFKMLLYITKKIHINATTYTELFFNSNKKDIRIHPQQGNLSYLCLRVLVSRKVTMCYISSLPFTNHFSFLQISGWRWLILYRHISTSSVKSIPIFFWERCHIYLSNTKNLFNIIIIIIMNVVGLGQ
jgi:hypothetical protein